MPFTNNDIIKRVPEVQTACEYHRKTLVGLHKLIIEANRKRDTGAIATLARTLINKSLEALDNYEINDTARLQNEFNRLYSLHERQDPIFLNRAERVEIPTFVFSVFNSILSRHGVNLFDDSTELANIYMKHILKPYDDFIQNSCAASYVAPRQPAPRQEEIHILAA